MKNLVLKMLVVSFGFLSCNIDADDIVTDDNQSNNVSECDFQSEINSDDYAIANAEEITINEITIDNDCLKINFWAGGCNGDSWEMRLIDSGAILESLPVQRNLRIDFVSEELCEKAILREYTFDISNLQIENNESLMLNIINNNSSILYEY